MGYTRVSTDEQDGKVHGSPELQRTQLVALGAVRVFHDAISGKTMERPGLLEALAMLERGEARALAVTKIDRLTRRLRDAEELLDTHFGGRFALVVGGSTEDTVSAKGRFIFLLQVLLAQFEREQTAERTRGGLAHKRAMGGGTPRLEGAAVERILALAASGASLRAIAAALEAEGHKTLRGGRWAPGNIHKVLQRAARDSVG